MSFSEKYKSFLEIEMKKAPLEKKQLDDRGHLLISWWDRIDRVMVDRGSPDIIDSIYFGEDPSRTIVIDQKVAKMLRERLYGLEEENIRLHRQIERMKIIMCGLTLITIMAIVVSII